MGSGETRKRKNWVMLGNSVLLACLAVAETSTPSFAIAEDAYQQDYSSQDGLIPTENGNLSATDPGACGFHWSAQAVIDTDLPNYSQNGFLESVWPTGAEIGSGYLSLQHWVNGPDVDHISNDQLNWRIPIAVDGGVSDARVAIVFDDPDWVPNSASLHQYSAWTQQPGYESAFHRFTGVTGYRPHDDTQLGDFMWGSSESGDATLTFSLGNLQPGTSTVIGFTGTARSTPGMSGVENIAAGTAYGAKLTVDGVRPLTECYHAEYPESTARAGALVTVAPITTSGSGVEAALPPGTSFALDSTAPADASIDPHTGTIHWPVPTQHPAGDTSIPVSVRLPDDGDFTAGSRIAAEAPIEVTAVSGFEPAAPASPPQEQAEVSVTEGTGLARSHMATQGAGVLAVPDSSERLDPEASGKRTAVQAVPESFSFHARGASSPRITVESTSALWAHLLLILGSGALLGGAGMLVRNSTRAEGRARR